MKLTKGETTTAGSLPHEEVITMNNKYITKILAEFDERFELEAQGCSECGGFELIDKKEEQFPKGKYHCEYDLEKIKSFLSTKIAQAIAEERERVRGEIKGRKI